MRFDEAWASRVREVCDPVLAAADVDFTGSVHTERRRGVTALLWEADPLLFLERYPDSEVDESYGDQWPGPCIDFWVYVDAASSTAETSTEGWDPSVDVHDLPLTGDGTEDGRTIAAVLARILRVGPPR